MPGSFTKIWLNNPLLFKNDPYGNGWFFVVHSHGEKLKGLFSGSTARKWFEWEVEKLRYLIEKATSIARTDGGHLLSDITKVLTAKQWKRLVASLLLTDVIKAQ